MMVLLGVLGLGCAWLVPVDGDSPCREAGYAIARRTFECTADADLANARYDLFLAETECIPLTYDEQGNVTSGPGAGSGVKAEDTYHCAFLLGELACEVVEALGDDIDAWLASSDACAYVIEEATP